MQLIDGAPLSEHFSSLKEKGLCFSEERIWKIFVQVKVSSRLVQCRDCNVRSFKDPVGILMILSQTPLRLNYKVNPLL